VVAERLDYATPVGRAVLGWPGNPDSSADALPLRLAGGLHCLVRRGRFPKLAHHYPPKPLPVPHELWEAVAEVFADSADELLPWLDVAPQTNEVGRSAVLFAGLSHFASVSGEPIHLFEIGASSGFNLNLDRYGYRFGGEQFGDSSSLLQLSPSWQGLPPPRAEVRIASRQGCDLSPLDATSPADRERLLAYVWPDQAERLARLVRALDIAAHHPIGIEASDAANWLERKMPQTGVRVLMHSIAFQYFEQRSQERITRFMERIGAASDSPLGWLRFELDPELDNRFSLRLRMWPGGSDQLLAIAGPHGTPIEWLAP
jgi:hypothetical protein